MNCVNLSYEDISSQLREIYNIGISQDTFKTMVSAGLSRDDIIYFSVQEYYGALLKSEESDMQRKEIYKNAYDLFTKLQLERGAIDQGINTQIINFAIPFIRQKDILEIGSGAGTFADRIIGLVKSYSFVEPSHDSCQLLLEKLSGHEKLRYFHQGVIQELSGIELDVDVVYCNDVYEHLHLDDTRRMIEVSYKILRKTGRILIVASNRLYGPFDGTERYRGKGSIATGLHINETTYQEITEVLRRAGFKKVKSPLMPIRVFNLPFFEHFKGTWPIMVSTRWKAIIEIQYKYLGKFLSTHAVIVVAEK